MKLRHWVFIVIAFDLGLLPMYFYPHTFWAPAILWAMALLVVVPFVQRVTKVQEHRSMRQVAKPRTPVSA